MITLDGSNVSTVGVINQGTAQATTSGTNIYFTGIPAGVKRITVSLVGVSTSGSAFVMVQVGSGSLTTSGYLGSATYFNTAGSSSNNSNGFKTDYFGNAADIRHGIAVLVLVSGNIWAFSSMIGASNVAATGFGAGSVTLSGTLDRLALTTSNGTDTFNAGSVNIQYE